MSILHYIIHDNTLQDEILIVEQKNNTKRSVYEIQYISSTQDELMPVLILHYQY